MASARVWQRIRGEILGRLLSDHLLLGRALLFRFASTESTFPIPMSAEEPTTDPPSSDNSQGAPSDKSADELHQELEELRAELTRLKAQQARSQTQSQSWIERRPHLAMVLSTVLGAAAGYGAAVATRSRPPTLSEQAQARFQGLAEGAQETGQDVQEEAQELARLAIERAQQAGSEAGETLRQATEEASAEAQALGETLAEEAESTIEGIEGQAESVQDTLTAEEESSGLRQSIYAAVGLAAGGYLAAKVSQWV